MLDRGLRAGPRAAVVTADEHDVGLALRDAGRHGADADLGHELHADAGLRVGVFQVVDQLGQIFDRIDIVMRRRRNQADAGRAMADAGDFFVDLMPRQLSSFAGLGALGHLDLQFAGVDEILACYAESAARNLLDCAGTVIAVGVRRITGGIFAPFARVALSADAVHGDGERFVGFFRDRAVRHGAGRESFDDRRDRLDLVEWNRLVGPFEFKQAAEREQPCPLLVDQPAIVLELLAAVDPRGLLELGDHVGAEHVGLPLAAPLIMPADVEIERLRHFGAGISMLVSPQRLLGDPVEADSLDAAGGPSEILVDERRCQADRLEDLRAAIALLRRDPHFRDHFEQPLGRGLDEVLLEVLLQGFRREVTVGLHLSRASPKPDTDSQPPRRRP